MLIKHLRSSITLVSQPLSKMETNYLETVAKIFCLDTSVLEEIFHIFDYRTEYSNVIPHVDARTWQPGVTIKLRDSFSTSHIKSGTYRVMHYHFLSFVRIERMTCLYFFACLAPFTGIWEYKYIHNSWKRKIKHPNKCWPCLREIFDLLLMTLVAGFHLVIGQTQYHLLEVTV